MPGRKPRRALYGAVADRTFAAGLPCPGPRPTSSPLQGPIAFIKGLTMAGIKNVAVQMDHVSTINIAGDSTFAMSLEAQARGYKLFHYTPNQLSMRDGKIYATAE